MHGVTMKVLEEESVYSAVRAESLSIRQVTFSL